MSPDAYATIGLRIAEKEYQRRGAPSAPWSQIVIGRDELAALLALAVEEGWKRGYAAGKGLPAPEGLISKL